MLIKAPIKISMLRGLVSNYSHIAANTEVFVADIDHSMVDKDVFFRVLCRLTMMEDTIFADTQRDLTLFLYLTVEEAVAVDRIIRELDNIEHGEPTEA